MRESGNDDEFQRFCRVSAPNILFPYAREHVSRLTSDAPNGIIRLDPVNFSGFLQPSRWMASGGSSSPTEPSPPSGQSPSAAPEKEP
jgi:preprotein translocase subunit SecB